MSIERLKHTKEMLMAQIESQMGHLQDVDAKELGEVVDMVKDIEEAIYYCTITEAMKKKEEDWKQQPQQNITYYTEPYYNKMYYDGGRSQVDNQGSSNGSNYMRDSNEGRSHISRKMYMEHKQTHADKTVKMRDLENYMSELNKDIVEMIEGASPEEKQLLQQKISTLAQKIV